MSMRATCVAHRFVFWPHSIYLENDRVEVGATNFVFLEQMRRMAYRDVRRVVAWPDSCRVSFFSGLAMVAISVVLGLLAVLIAVSNADAGVAVASVFGVTGAGVLGLGGALLWAGRARGLTRLRIEGVHGHIDAVLSGRLQKREKVLAELARRIRERQTVG